MDPFCSTDYRDFLRQKLLETKKQLGKPFTFQNLAQSCRVSKTYLSKVLRGDGHLNEDQLFSACTFLRLTPAEITYLSMLQQFQKSVHMQRKQRLQQELRILKQRHESTESHLTNDIEKLEDLRAEYFLNADSILVHLVLTIDRYRNNLDLIADDLNLDKRTLAGHLRLLESLGFIKFSKNGCEIFKDRLHISKESPLFAAHRENQRLRALMQLRTPYADPYSFSLSFTGNEDTKNIIKKEFLQFLQSVEKVVKSAKSESVYQLNFDLFDWVP